MNEALVYLRAGRRLYNTTRAPVCSFWLSFEATSLPSSGCLQLHFLWLQRIRQHCRRVCRSSEITHMKWFAECLPTADSRGLSRAPFKRMLWKRAFKELKLWSGSLIQMAFWNGEDTCQKHKQLYKWTVCYWLQREINPRTLGGLLPSWMWWWRGC